MSLWSTCHAEGPPQPRGQLLGVVVPELHASDADDLTHKADPVPLQVLTAQVLRAGDIGTERQRDGERD